MNPHLQINRIHHISIICSDYEVSKQFYTNILGLKILQEIYRSERDSFKLDLALDSHFIIEMFSFPNTPQRLSQPEARGLRHLAFEVNDIQKTYEYFQTIKYPIEDIRTDEHTHKKFTFISDPDGLPIEFYEK